MTTTEYDRILQPALDRYSAALAEHYSVGMAERVELVEGTRYQGTCRCGWTSSRTYREAGTARRASGLHVSAAHKRADRAFDVEAAELFAAARAVR